MSPQRRRQPLTLWGAINTFCHQGLFQIFSNQISPHWAARADPSAGSTAEPTNLHWQISEESFCPWSRNWTIRLSNMIQRPISLSFVMCHVSTGLVWSKILSEPCQHTDVWDICVCSCVTQGNITWDWQDRWVWQYLDKEPTWLLHVFVFSTETLALSWAVCFSPKNPGQLTEPAWRRAGSSCPCAWIK